MSASSLFNAQSLSQSQNNVFDVQALQKLKNAHGNEEAALRETAKQFESIFIRQLLKSMRQANEVFKEDSLFDSSSVDFYQGLFGMPIQARQGSTVCLRIGDGPQFMSLAPTVTNEPPSITHIGLSVADFDIDAVSSQLAKHGFASSAIPATSTTRLDMAMKRWITTRGPDQGGDRTGSRELFFTDREGLIMQLSASGYCGGSGPTGNTCDLIADNAQATQEGLMRLEGISHFTNFLSNRDHGNQFYAELFGLAVQVYQGPSSPVLGVGDGIQFLMYVGGSSTNQPTSPGSINHVSFNLSNFNVDDILAKLSAYGIEPRGSARGAIPPLVHYVTMRMPNRGGAEGGTPELYFTDPDGLRIQLQDISYCGGGGYLGDQCG